MLRRAANLLCILSLSFSVAYSQDTQPQSAQSLVQQAVDAERAANQSDHSKWLYLEDSRKPKEHILQWVATTQQGDVRRVFERNDQKLPEPEQRDLVQKFVHDPRAQKKQAEENRHDDQQVDDFLKLLPVGFVWTLTGSTPTDTLLHFEPKPDFHAPTREARVFSGMVGDLAVDNRQHRVHSIKGHLIHDVTFGGGLLGRLKEGSTFALEQAQCGDSSWQLTAIHVHLEGNALLFKSVSLQEDDERSKFALQPQDLTLEQAAATALAQPD